MEKGDQEIFASREELVRTALREYEMPLIGYAMTFLHDVERARDVVQDTFIRLYQQDAEKVRHGLKTWLFTVCRNRALDILRKEKRMVALEEQKLSRIPASRRTPSERMDLDERVNEVREALERLSGNQREVVLLKFEQGLSYREISEVTGLKEGNVGFLIHTGLKKLREHLPEDLLQDISPQTV